MSYRPEEGSIMTKDQNKKTVTTLPELTVDEQAKVHGGRRGPGSGRSSN
jgi:hypothetical protein